MHHRCANLRQLFTTHLHHPTKKDRPLTAALIDGKAIAARIRGEIAAQVEQMARQHSIQPGLAAVLVGDNPASATYVRMKRRACEEVGIASFGIELPATISQQELESQIRELNAR